jgi:FkbM family methyltransferase
MRSVFPPEDEIRLLREFFGSQPGTFVDVGANDPVVGSQTYALERAGWEGVLVEPLPHLAERLRAERSAQVFQFACGPSSQQGEHASFYVAGPYSSLRREAMLPEAEVESVIDVEIRALDSIIEAACLTHVDFLSIDVEGFELDVLRGFAIPRWRPRLILIEDHVTGLRKHRYLATQGYKLVRRTGVNAWYVPRRIRFPLGPWGRWQLFRKYVLGLGPRKLRSLLRRRQSGVPR